MGGQLTARTILAEDVRPPLGPQHSGCGRRMPCTFPTARHLGLLRENKTGEAQHRTPAAACI